VTEEVLKEAVKQVPALVVLVGVVGFLVIKFLGFIKESEDRREKSETARTEALAVLNDQCHEHQSGMMGRYEAAMANVTAAMDRNSAAMGRASEALSRTEDYLSHLEGKFGAITSPRKKPQ
jgi:hypothetical protein